MMCSPLMLEIVILGAFREDFSTEIWVRRLRWCVCVWCNHFQPRTTYQLVGAILFAIRAGQFHFQRQAQTSMRKNSGTLKLLGL